jgi:murein L,D-transpeptidase YafK
MRGYPAVTLPPYLGGIGQIYGLATLSRMLRSILYAFAALIVAVTLAACGGLAPPPNTKAIKPLPSALVSKIASIGSTPGAPMMVRIFKQTSELEVWKQTSGGSYKLLKTYEICAYSGGLGPKIKEGDRQSPEGFYNITPGLLNPNSNYYLAFNTGFPNKFDRAYGRTGSDLMVHGDCSSRGCYAMTDEGISEIYALARETFKGGNASFQLQIFPFRMTAENLAKNAKDPNISFWKNIKTGYDRFEISRAPSAWDVCNKQYVFDVPSGTTLDASAACPTSVASLSPDLQAKQAADQAAMDKAVSDLQAKEAKAAADAQKAADDEAAAKARGEAIGDFFGGMFGGGDRQKVIDPTVEAPVPAPRPNRA